MKLLAGTSGYSFDEWRGVFYPDDLPAAQRLRYYAQRLSTVEINNTFYRMPGEKLIRSWMEQAPPGFRFSLKTPQRITHRARLTDPDALAYFVGKASLMGPQLACTLVQLPPNFQKDAERLRHFLAQVPTALKPALEFRHPSWFDGEIESILRNAGAALCWADEDDQECPMWVTALHGYARLRREGYGETLLRQWARQLRQSGWTEAFAYFKHEDGARGAAYAESLEKFFALQGAA